MINVCIAIDENYAPYCSTVIVSILENSTDKDIINFYILCNNISDKTKHKILQLKKIKNCEISFIDIEHKEFENFPAGGPHISNTTYYRYKIAELLTNIDKIIYLDCDVIVKDSLEGLYSIDLTNYALAGVEDIGYTLLRTQNPAYIYQDFYINAGVLLINLDYWRKNHAFEQLVNYTNENVNIIKAGDQDVINAVFKNKIYKLDYKWNCQDSFFRNGDEIKFNTNKDDIIYAANHPSIIHFTGIKKPWNKPFIVNANLFWKYYLQTPFNIKGICNVIKQNIIKNFFSLSKNSDRFTIRILGVQLSFRTKKIVTKCMQNNKI